MKISDFNENYMLPLLDKISKIDKKCFLVGDFNIDLLKKESKTPVFDFYENMTSYFFSPFILQPTRITPHSKTLIDNIFFNALEFQTFSGNLTVEISDHLIQFLVLTDFQKYVSSYPQNVYKRDYNFFIQDEFQNELLNVNWKNIVTSHNTFDENFNYFFKTLENLVDIHAPLKKLSKKEISLKTKPWINNKIIKDMKKRDKYF